MKVHKKCLPCIVNQTVKFIEATSPRSESEIFKKVFEYLSRTDFENAITPEVVGEIFAIVTGESGNPDPYKLTREFYNKMLSEQSTELEEAVDRAHDPFAEAVKYAIIGNVIDFSPGYELTAEAVQGYFSKFGRESLEIDHTALLKKDILTAKTILYIGDNCGEIVLDKILLKKIREINPAAQIYFVTKGAPTLNDSVKEDALALGIQEYASVIDHGDNCPGTVLHRTSEEFRRLFERTDVVISKGQANYEGLNEAQGNIYFLLIAKCAAIAQDIGTSEMKMICKKK